jgi:hypothetical protein
MENEGEFGIVVPASPSSWRVGVKPQGKCDLWGGVASEFRSFRSRCKCREPG